jgi:hypothetical protein
MANSTIKGNRQLPVLKALNSFSSRFSSFTVPVGCYSPGRTQGGERVGTRPHRGWGQNPKTYETKWPRLKNFVKHGDLPNGRILEIRGFLTGITRITGAI